MSKSKFKMIVVKTSGTLHLLSGVAGPILTAFPCSIDTILHLLRTNINVYEVLSDGTEIKLTLDNFNKVNEKGYVEKKETESHKLDNTTVSKPNGKAETKKENNTKEVTYEEKKVSEELSEDKKDNGVKSEGSDNNKNKSNPPDKYKNSNNNRK